MSELKPSSEASGASNKLLRETGRQSTQENALEEKVSCEKISPGEFVALSIVTEWLAWFFFLQATELFLRAVQEEQNGAGYEGSFSRMHSDEKIVCERRRWLIILPFKKRKKNIVQLTEMPKSIHKNNTDSI